MGQTEPEKVVRFSVAGAVPSKSNYRWSNSAKGRAGWKRIKDYETLVGWEAKAAGCKIAGPVELRLTICGGATDLDNGLKAPVDGLKGVAYQDDSQAFLGRIEVLREDAEKPRLDFEVRYVGRPVFVDGGK